MIVLDGSLNEYSITRHTFGGLTCAPTPPGHRGASACGQFPQFAQDDVVAGIAVGGEADTPSGPMMTTVGTWRTSYGATWPPDIQQDRERDRPPPVRRWNSDSRVPSTLTATRRNSSRPAARNSFKRRHFGLPRVAPERPEVQHHGLALVVFQRTGAAARPAGRRRGRGCRPAGLAGVGAAAADAVASRAEQTEDNAMSVSWPLSDLGPCQAAVAAYLGEVGQRGQAGQDGTRPASRRAAGRSAASGLWAGCRRRTPRGRRAPPGACSPPLPSDIVQREAAVVVVADTTSQPAGMRVFQLDVAVVGVGVDLDLHVHLGPGRHGCRPGTGLRRNAVDATDGRPWLCGVA